MKSGARLQQLVDREHCYPLVGTVGDVEWLKRHGYIALTGPGSAASS